MPESSLQTSESMPGTSPTPRMFFPIGGEYRGFLCNVLSRLRETLLNAPKQSSF